MNTKLTKNQKEQMLNNIASTVKDNLFSKDSSNNKRFAFINREERDNFSFNIAAYNSVNRPEAKKVLLAFVGSYTVINKIFKRNPSAEYVIIDDKSLCSLFSDETYKKLHSNLKIEVISVEDIICSQLNRILNGEDNDKKTKAKDMFLLVNEKDNNAIDIVLSNKGNASIYAENVSSRGIDGIIKDNKKISKITGLSESDVFFSALTNTFKNMKFDTIIANPPYNKTLHLKILATTVNDVLEDGGVMLSLQPLQQFGTLRHTTLRRRRRRT